MLYLIRLLIALSLMVLLIGCKDDVPDAQEPINSLEMTLNGNFWQPVRTDEIGCTQGLSWIQSEWNGSTFYTIQAFQGSIEDRRTIREVRLELQVMHVNQPGSFSLDGPWHGLSSYATFIVRKENSHIVYKNDSSGRSMVEIFELMPVSGSLITGLSGRFEAVLFNEVDPRDSIIIEDGYFSLQYPPTPSYDQCPSFWENLQLD